MSRPVSNLRLFVAAYPPPECAHAMLQTLRGYELPPNRSMPAEQVHLTLQFIGDTPAKDLDNTIESVRRAAGGLNAFALRPVRLVTLPERGPARLIAAETDSPPVLLELQRRLAQRLARNAREKAGDRFRPHFTLCRFAAPVRLPIDQALSLNGFELTEVLLMRSTLSPRGAQHHVIATCELNPA